MNVELVNHTPNPEAFIAYIARVSSPDNQNNAEYAKLIKYLLKNKHFSPFEHSYFTFKVITSRAIATQLLRHRSFVFQEFSLRYSAAETIEPIELRKQATKNRQSSTDIFDPIVQYGDEDLLASELVKMFLDDIFWLYSKLIEKGVAKESARFILPLATTTTIYITGNLRSFIHYLELRTDHHTQKEHRMLAQQIEQHLRLYVPTVFEALDDIKQEQVNNELLLKLLTR